MALPTATRAQPSPCSLLHGTSESPKTTAYPPLGFSPSANLRKARNPPHRERHLCRGPWAPQDHLCMPQLEPPLTRSHTASLAICGPSHCCLQEGTGLKMQGEGMEGEEKTGTALGVPADPEGCPAPVLTAVFQATSSLFFPSFCHKPQKKSGLAVSCVCQEKVVGCRRGSVL